MTAQFHNRTTTMSNDSNITINMVHQNNTTVPETFPTTGEIIMDVDTTSNSKVTKVAATGHWSVTNASITTVPTKEFPTATIPGKFIPVNTDSKDWSTSHATIEVLDAPSSSSVGVGVGVGVGIGLALLLAFIIAVICIVRRRKRREREKNIIRMENPKYKLEEEEETLRHPATFDLTVHREPFVKFQGNNNASVKYETNGSRKKEAPVPPSQIYRPNNKVNTDDSASKRKAPSPPQKKIEMLDLYEKDSNPGSLETLTSPYTASNHNANNDLVGEDASHFRPLLEDSFIDDKHSPKKPSKHQPIGWNVSLEQQQPEEQDNGHAKTALLKKEKERSNLSLDSYDKTKNPFFS